MVLPHLGTTHKWKDMLDQSSVNDDNNRYVQILNSLQNVHNLKQSNKGMSYILIEEKQKDKGKQLEDQIQIVAAPKLNSNMIQSDRRISMKIRPAQYSQERRNRVNTDVFVPLPYKVKSNKVSSSHIKS